jgi:hypothetical protein
MPMGLFLASPAASASTSASSWSGGTCRLMRPMRAASVASMRLHQFHPGFTRHVAKDDRHDHHREDADVHFGHAKLRVARGDGEIAGRDQPEPTGERVAVDAGDGGLAQFGHLEEEIGEVTALEVAVQLRLLAAKAVQVGTGAEDHARSGDHDDPDLRVALCLLESLSEFGNRFGAQGVAVVGTVDRDRGDRVAPPIEEVFELHRLKYMARHFGLRHPSRMQSWRTSSWSRRRARRLASWAAASQP